MQHPTNHQNFNDEGFGECDSGEYCRFVHPGPRWANARSYHNRDEFEYLPKFWAGGGGGGGSVGGRGRPGGGGGGKGPIAKRCRVSLFSFHSDMFPTRPPLSAPSKIAFAPGRFPKRRLIVSSLRSARGFTFIIHLFIIPYCYAYFLPTVILGFT